MQPDSHTLANLWETFKNSQSGVKKTPPPQLPSADDGDDLLSLLCEPSFNHLLQTIIGTENLKKFYKSTSAPELVARFSTEHSGHGIYNPADRGAIGDAQIARSYVDNLSTRLMRDLSQIITTRFHEGAIPSSGTFLAFTFGLKYVFLFKYVFHFGTASVEAVDFIENPKGVLEIESIAKLESQKSRNFSKSFLTSGHKLILQNGVLTHVDRRRDSNVFGPTIDTLLLCDIIGKDRHASPIEKVVEIGCGSGHITTFLATRLPLTKECVAIDSNPHAISCTARNLDSNLRKYGRENIKKFIIYGEFSGSLFNYSADLIVANPPYVALPPYAVDLRSDRYSDAIAGTQLIPSILNTIPRGLRRNGRLLLMVSSTSFDVVEKNLPGSHEFYDAWPESSFDVPFDVESVLDEPRWLEWLHKSDAVTEADGSWYHKLRPLWIKEK
jgi:methylase of polypeptide subunit release factors